MPISHDGRRLALNEQEVAGFMASTGEGLSRLREPLGQARVWATGRRALVVFVRELRSLKILIGLGWSRPAAIARAR